MKHKPWSNTPIPANQINTCVTCWMMVKVNGCVIRRVCFGGLSVVLDKLVTTCWTILSSSVSCPENVLPHPEGFIVQLSYKHLKDTMAEYKQRTLKHFLEYRRICQGCGATEQASRTGDPQHDLHRVMITDIQCLNQKHRKWQAQQYLLFLAHIYMFITQLFLPFRY